MLWRAGLISAIIGRSWWAFLPRERVERTVMRFYPVYLAAICAEAVGMVAFFGLSSTSQTTTVPAVGMPPRAAAGWKL